MTPRQKVLAKHPNAALLKSSISNWGVALIGTKRWLSYGAGRPHLAWKAAAESIEARNRGKGT